MTASSSNGFYIDTSPPTISDILHLDVAYSSQEPVTCQGNDHTIQVAFYTEDPSSGVHVYLCIASTFIGIVQ